MEIPTGKLTLVSYNPESKIHYRFMRDLTKDPLYQKWGFYHIDDHLKASANLESLEPNHSYIVEKEQLPIGYLRLGNQDFQGTQKFDYGLHEDYRGQNLGYTLVKEVSTYLLANMENIKQLRADVNIYNQKSILLLLKAGYQIKKRVDQTYDLRYMEEDFPKQK